MCDKVSKKKQEKCEREWGVEGGMIVDRGMGRRGG